MVFTHHTFPWQTVTFLPKAVQIAALRMTDTGVINLIVRIVLSTLTVLLTLVVGLLLRRMLIQRLRKTVLDTWIIQTLGLLILLAPVLLGTIVALAIWNYLAAFVTAVNQTFNTNIYSIGGNLLLTLILIMLGVGFARTINTLTLRGMGEKRIDINIRTLISRIFYVLTLIIVGFWILSLWQVPLGNVVASLGIVTLVITVAIQDILKDLVAGFYLLFERPFFIGDQISVTVAPTVTYVGKVEDVRLRATRLRLVGGEEITIPNTLLFGGSVINNTYYGERRAAIAITLPQSAFAGTETTSQILQAIKALDTTVEKPEPAVSFYGYAEERVKLLVRFWQASAQIMDVSDAMCALHALLPDAELEAREPIGLI